MTSRLSSRSRWHGQFTTCAAALIALVSVAAGPLRHAAAQDAVTQLAADQSLTTASVDAYVEQAALRDGIELPPLVDDDLFLRRVSLDLLGRIPTREELLQFRRQPDRAALVGQLLAHPEHAQFWSRLWTNTLIGYGQSPAVDREALRRWIERRFTDDQAFDETVFQLISAEGSAAFDGATNFMLRHARDPVVPVGRIFLGVQLDCARCHDHPTDRWTQSDFEGMQRFFAGMRPRQPSPGNYQLQDVSVQGNVPQFLTGTKPRTVRWRQELALMITTSKPFARATANRLWYHLMGHGISHQPDAVNGGGRSVDFALIESLAEQLQRDDFCWKSMVRQLCLSQTYQRRLSTSGESWHLLPTAKPMTPDQLFVSLHTAMNEPIVERRRGQFTRAATSASLDQPFHNAWQSQEPLGALMGRMNMPLPNPNLSTKQLFEQVLTRDPTDEQERLCQDQPRRNVLFALLNSNEFYFWH